MARTYLKFPIVQLGESALMGMFLNFQEAMFMAKQRLSIKKEWTRQSEERGTIRDHHCAICFFTTGSVVSGCSSQNYQNMCAHGVCCVCTECAVVIGQLLRKVEARLSSYFPWESGEQLQFCRIESRSNFIFISCSCQPITFTFFSDLVLRTPL